MPGRRSNGSVPVMRCRRLLATLLCVPALACAGLHHAIEATLSPAEGRLEWAFRISPIFRFGGGTNEIMRDIIAVAGLGLPR